MPYGILQLYAGALSYATGVRLVAFVPYQIIVRRSRSASFGRHVWPHVGGRDSILRRCECMVCATYSSLHSRLSIVQLACGCCDDQIISSYHFWKPELGMRTCGRPYRPSMTEELQQTYEVAW